MTHVYVGDVGELFNDLCIVLCSIQQTNCFKVSFSRLQHKIMRYDVKRLTTASAAETDCELPDVGKVHGSEDYILHRSPASPFFAVGIRGLFIFNAKGQLVC